MPLDQPLGGKRKPTSTFSQYKLFSFALQVNPFCSIDSEQDNDPLYNSLFMSYRGGFISAIQ